VQLPLIYAFSEITNHSSRKSFRRIDGILANLSVFAILFFRVLLGGGVCLSKNLF